MSSLVTVAEISQWLSLVSIVFCFAVMVVILMRLRPFLDEEALDDHGGGGITFLSRPPVSMLAMTKVNVPLTVELFDPRHCTMDRVLVRIVTEPPFKVSKLTMRTFAGVSIGRFHHQVLVAPWAKFRKAVISDDDDVFLFGCQSMSPIKKVELRNEDVSHTNEDDAKDSITIRVTEPDLVSPGVIRLGDRPPRQWYPLVVCFLLDETDVNSDLNTGQIGAFLTVIHVKDDKCPFPSQILSSHIKHTDGRSTCLRSLFVSSDDNGDEDHCAVCQDRRVSHVILPCRHACVCRRCFHRLRNTCPICRTRIDSFFLMDDQLEANESEDEDQRSDSPEAAGQRRTWAQALHDFNHRFSMAMGLRDNQ